MLFINTTLSKNQLCKQQNQINKAPTFSSKQEKDFSFFIFSPRHFTECLQFTFVLSQDLDFPMPGGCTEKYR